MLSMLKSLIIYTINKKMQNINIMYMWNIHVNSYFIKKKKKSEMQILIFSNKQSICILSYANLKILSNLEWLPYLKNSSRELE